MDLLLEIADRDLIFIALAFLGVVIFVVIIVYIIKRNKVKPLPEEERYDREEKPVELTEEQKQAKAELERVFNMMSADLEAEEEEISPIDEFEREQEENAIISYQELIKQAKAKGQIKEEPVEIKEDNFEALEEESYPKPSYQAVYETHEEELYSKPSYQAVYETHEEELYSKPSYQNVYETHEEKPLEEKKKFKNSEFISPIFGIQNGNPSYPTVKKIDRSKKVEDENTQFLNSLKEFRENL